MIEYEFCMTADISKILAMVDLSSWAGHGLGAQTFCFIRVLLDHVSHSQLSKGQPLRPYQFSFKQNASPLCDPLNFYCTAERIS